MEICCVEEDDEVVILQKDEAVLAQRSKRAKTDHTVNLIENSIERLERVVSNLSEKIPGLPLKLSLRDKEAAALVAGYTKEISSVVGKYVVLCEVMSCS